MSTAERALPTAEQRGQWQTELAQCRAWLDAWGHNRAGCWWPLLILAHESEHEALWVLVDDLAADVETFRDRHGVERIMCNDCSQDWIAGQPEKHCGAVLNPYSCLTGRARALRKAAGRE